MSRPPNLDAGSATSGLDPPENLAFLGFVISRCPREQNFKTGLLHGDIVVLTVCLFQNIFSRNSA